MRSRRTNLGIRYYAHGFFAWLIARHTRRDIWFIDMIAYRKTLGRSFTAVFLHFVGIPLAMHFSPASAHAALAVIFSPIFYRYFRPSCAGKWQVLLKQSIDDWIHRYAISRRVFPAAALTCDWHFAFTYWYCRALACRAAYATGQPLRPYMGTLLPPSIW